MSSGLGGGRTPNEAGHAPAQLAPRLYIPTELVADQQRWYTNCATQADLDGDGHIDLIIGNYFPDGARVLDASATEREEMQDSMSRAYNGGRDRLFLWAGAPGCQRHLLISP